LFRLAILTLVSGWFSINEIQYLAMGRTTTAEIRNISHFFESGGGWQSRLWGGTDRRTIEYSFKDDAEKEIRTEKSEIPKGSPMPNGGTVKVQYIPREKGASRIAGDRNLIPLVGFAVCSIFTLIFSVRWARNYEPPNAKPKRSNRKEKRGK
jgi:hypothetical protein